MTPRRSARPGVTAMVRQQLVNGTIVPLRRSTDTVRLLDADPDLGALLSDARREQAERELVVTTHRLPVGPWDVSRLTGATADRVGLLILTGVLSRELIVADHLSAEPLGPGDLVRPWQPASRPGFCRWTQCGRCSRR